MSEWSRTTTADLIDSATLEIGDGYRAKNVEFVRGGGLPFVRVGDVGVSSINLSGVDQLPAGNAAKYGSKVSQSGDSLITMKGTVGRVAFVAPGIERFVYSPQISYWRSHDKERLDPRWLRYWLESPEFTRQASASKGATDMADYINLRDQRRMTITLPPVCVQRQIADVLADVDELIDNSRRRVAVLEEMGRAIYREWFVHFRYPGHESRRLVESQLGFIPQGWNVRCLTDLARVDKGLSYKGVFLTESGTPMANLKCFRPGGGFRRAGTKPYSGPYKSAHEVVPGDLIMANTDLTQAGTVIGSPAFVSQRDFADGGIISHHLFAIRPTQQHLSQWLYESFCDARFRAYARGVASGTTVLGFRPADLNAYRLVVPPHELLEEFDDLRGGLARLVEGLEDMSDKLTEVRSHILPRLVTGQIDASLLIPDTLAEGSAA